MVSYGELHRGSESVCEMGVEIKMRHQQLVYPEFVDHAALLLWLASLFGKLVRNDPWHNK